LSKLPLLSWREVVKTLGKAGFKIARQKGSHIILVKDERIVRVPRHAEIKRGLLMEIINGGRPCERGIPATPLDRIVASFSSRSCPRNEERPLGDSDQGSVRALAGPVELVPKTLGCSLLPRGFLAGQTLSFSMHSRLKSLGGGACRIVYTTLLVYWPSITT